VQAELEFRAGEPPIRAVPVRAASPDDVLGAVHDLPAEVRAVFARHGSLDHLDALMRHPSAAGWSPLQHLSHVVDTLHRTAMWAVAAIDEERAQGAPGHLAARPDANQAPPRAVLGALDQACTDLADAISRMPVDAWVRPLGDTTDPAQATTVLGVLDVTIVDVRRHLVEIDTLLAARG
jgi:hypothetical protein